MTAAVLPDETAPGRTAEELARTTPKGLLTGGWVALMLPVMPVDRLLQLRALAHPARLQLLSLLTGSAMSAAEAARQMGMSQANTSYHLRLLERAGLVVVVEQVSIRGGQARRYRHVPAQDGQRFGEAPPPGSLDDREAEQAFLDVLAVELRRRYALRSGGPATNVDAELWVTPAVWREVVAAIGAASDRLHSQAQPPDRAGAVRVSATVSLFQMSP